MDWSIYSGDLHKQVKALRNIKESSKRLSQGPHVHGLAVKAGLFEGEYVVAPCRTVQRDRTSSCEQLHLSCTYTATTRPICMCNILVICSLQTSYGRRWHCKVSKG